MSWALSWFWSPPKCHQLILTSALVAWRLELLASADEKDWWNGQILEQIQLEIFAWDTGCFFNCSKCQNLLTRADFRGGGQSGYSNLFWKNLLTGRHLDVLGGRPVKKKHPVLWINLEVRTWVRKEQHEKLDCSSNRMSEQIVWIESRMKCQIFCQIW